MFISNFEIENEIQEYSETPTDDIMFNYTYVTLNYTMFNLT